MAETSLGQLAFVKEVTPGITPPTPAFKVLDFTSEDIALSTNQIRSNTVNASRVVKRSRRAGQEVGGGPTFELVKAPEIDELLEALLGNPFAGSPLRSKAGGSALSSFTFERKLTTGDFRRFTGCRVNTLELTIQPEQIIEAKFSLLGASEVTAATAVTGATYAAPGTGEKLTPLDVGAIAFANGLTGTFDFSQITMTITNGMASAKRIGASPVRGVVPNLAQITGRMDIYIEDKAVADAFLAETPFDVTIPLLNGGAGYTAEMKRLAITGYNDNNPGNGNSFIANIDYECTLDATYGSSFGFQRTA